MGSKRIGWFWIYFIMAAVVFFSGTLFLAFASFGDVFVSPDENANAFFSKHFSQTGSLSVPDPLTEQFDDALFPRSLVAKEGRLLPQSFVGLPVLYGAIAFVFGSNSLLVITPLLAIFAALALRAITRSWFSPAVSNLSAIFFLFHPAVWYYSARGLMHNVLFICLLIFGVFLFVCRPISKREWCHASVDVVASGALIGLSLFVRASEAFWVGALLFLFFVSTIKRAWKEIAGLCLGLLMGVLPFFLFNTATYGHPLRTGYAVFETSNVAEAAPRLFPFGIDPLSAAQHVADYGLLLFWWLSILALVGFAIVASRRRWYATIFCLVAIWLGIWYGSWTLFDNPDISQVTMANSYIRYWLPVFILSIPLIAEGTIWIAERARSTLARKCSLIALIILVIGLNIRLVFFEGQDALLRMGNLLSESREIKKDVLMRTPPEAVIVVDRADKLFFPQRHVRYPLRSEETYTLIPRLAKAVPLYYFGITLPEKDVEYLNRAKLGGFGLSMKFVKTYGEESLYKIEEKN